jgi:hypothetical protein
MPWQLFSFLGKTMIFRMSPDFADTNSEKSPRRYEMATLEKSHMIGL